MRWLTAGAACAIGSGCGGAESERPAASSESGIDPTGITDTSAGSEDEGGHDEHADSDAVFDVGSGEDLPGYGCGAEGGGGGDPEDGELELSYIWIANSSQGTISKIDTETMIEEGRYSAKPSGGDPSRTSVNLNGDVAVANRNGGVAKFWADIEDCVESNGMPGIQTSTGAADVLEFGQDECLAWYTELACGSNRPVAWTRGDWNDSTCSYENAEVWTVCDAQVHLLDGETGMIVQTIAIAGSPFVYGGAADADGNFWGLDVQQAQLIRVDGADHTIGTWPLPEDNFGYGITVDKEGRPWVCSGTVSRFNLDTSTWSTSPQSSGGGGCMTDGETTIWHGSGNSMVGFDTETLALIETIPLPEYVHGISIDFHGYVWGVGFASTNAYRADPVTDAVDTYSGLSGAYTYSDMTGFALSHAGGGGPPQG